MCEVKSNFWANYLIVVRRKGALLGRTAEQAPACTQQETATAAKLERTPYQMCTAESVLTHVALGVGICLCEISLSHRRPVCFAALRLSPKENLSGLSVTPTARVSIKHHV